MSVSIAPSISREGLALYLDAAQYGNSRNNLATTWVDYGGNQANYNVLGISNYNLGIYLKDTSSGWVGYFPATVSTTGTYTIAFSYYCDTGTASLTLDNDGIVDNQFNNTLNVTTTEQKYYGRVYVGVTGTINFFFRRGSGSSITVRNVVFFKSDIWYDQSGNNNHCNWSSIPSFDGKYFTFDGSTNYGTITNSSSLVFSNSQTLIMVLRHTYTSGRRNPWNQAYGGYGTWTHEQGEYISQYFGDYGADGSPYVGITSPTTPRNVWNVMCATRDINQHKWYINGTLSSTTTNPYNTLTYTGANIYIGNGYAGYWQGDMALVMAYSRTLSDSEVMDNFNTFRGRFSS